MLGGLITLVVFILVEVVVESVLNEMLFRDALIIWHQGLDIPQWGGLNKLLNIFIAFLNSTMLIWLYAALRPMFGVGVKTALVTSFFGFVFVTAFAINSVNIGYYAWEIALIETFYLMIELPVSIVVGAHFYEGMWEKDV
jgi:hypothetical protein